MAAIFSLDDSIIIKIVKDIKSPFRDANNKVIKER